MTKTKNNSKRNNPNHPSESRKLTFTLGNSIVKDSDDYLLLGLINQNFIFRVRYFHTHKEYTWNQTCKKRF